MIVTVDVVVVVVVVDVLVYVQVADGTQPLVQLLPGLKETIVTLKLKNTVFAN